MFSNLVVGFLMGIGVGGWVYSKAYRRTGGNNQSAVLVAGISGAVAWLVVTTLLGTIFKS